MKFKAIKPKAIIATSTVMLLAGLVVLTISLSTVPVSASPAYVGSGDLHVTKECSQYAGSAGSFCTITSSNLAEIKVGSRIYYGQAANIPPGVLDSNVVLDAGNGDRAVGRCILDFTTGLGLCTFSDGTGRFTNFQARIDVSFTGGANWRWDGKYTFNPGPH